MSDGLERESAAYDLLKSSESRVDTQWQWREKYEKAILDFDKALQEKIEYLECRYRAPESFKIRITDFKQAQEMFKEKVLKVVHDENE